MILVLVLGASALALDDDAGRLVGDAHGRVGPVDVLSASATGTIGINAQIGRVDVDLDRVIHFRINKYRGKRGVATIARVERRFAYQAVHAGFGAQPAVGVFAAELDRGAFDAGHLAFGDFDQFGGKAGVLTPAQIHAQQDIGPVLRLGAAGTGLDIDKGVLIVHRPGEHALELQPFEMFLLLVQIGNDRINRGFILFLDGHFQQFVGLIEFPGQFGNGVDDLFQMGPLAAQFLGMVGVVPDIRVFKFPANFSQPFLFGIEVKDTPSGLRVALACP